MSLKVNFYAAKFEDWKLLLDWRNDELARKNSLINMDVIEEEAHKKWLKATLENPDRRIYLAYKTGDKIGTVRFDRNGSSWEMSWNLAPEFRGRGLGKELVREACLFFPGNLTAQIKEDNVASIEAAKYAGLRNVGKKGLITLWELKKENHNA
ncbi:MAG: hypothetical protein A2X86_12350 [Bdellovibrionales bacterium GWA2_49_15]|nr:MAG: hypothetical protein A2X86_12350 [Bdellovibrionales bacterium GWA2_49_15]